VLLALQCALTMAVLCNAFLIVQQNRAELQREIGFSSHDVIGIETLPLRDGENRPATMTAELAALRALPGVRAVSVVSGIPLATAGAAQSVATGDGETRREIDSVDVLVADHHLVPTLGLTIVAGRDFIADDVVDVPASDQAPPPPAVLITEALARALFGQQSALGQTVNGMTIVGIVHDFAIGDRLPSKSRYGLILPGRRHTGLRSYLIRSDGDPETLTPAIERALRDTNPDRFVIGRYPLHKALQRTLSDERGTVIGLVTVMVLVSVIALAGIVGINAYTVRKRLRWFGVQRALGAARRDVLYWLLAEGAIVIGVGTALGVVLAIALNMQAPAIPVLIWHHVAIAALVVAVLVWLSTLLTARPAITVSPAVATRNI
jgi:putative ABC transport system permease protein